MAHSYSDTLQLQIALRVRGSFIIRQFRILAKRHSKVGAESTLGLKLFSIHQDLLP